jgi:tetrahydromethanopterin S-methyltransferase subunit G
MGLFSKKKPKPTSDDAATGDRPPTSADTVSSPFTAATPPPAPPAPPAPPVSQIESQRPSGKPPKKSKKVSIDPVDFLNLRAELVDVKARLMAAEQARAIVESRLAALDATALALSNEQQHSVGAGERLADLEARVAELADAPRDATLDESVPSMSDDDAAGLRESQALLQARIDEVAAAVASAGTDPDVLAKLTELEHQVAAATAAAEAGRAAPLDAAVQDDLHPALVARVDELAGRLDASPDHTSRFAELEARLIEVAAKADATPMVPLMAPSTPDADTIARLDELSEKVSSFEALGAQLAQLNARVIAQAEFGAQLSSLRDRINQLAADTDIRREAALAAATDAELRDRVNALADRMVVTEGLATQMGQLAERVSATDVAARQTAEQLATLEQRVDSVGTELANQLSELGRDIDGLAQHVGDAASGEVSDEVLDALRTGQVKLANEQARYEIAFREDLAALAEHVRRQPR